MNDKFLHWENEIKSKKIVSVQMNLLNACTSRCKSCRKYKWPKESLPLIDAKNVLSYLKQQGCSSVFFSGGDPIFYKHINELIDYCCEIKMPYSLITTLITKDKDLLAKIAKTAYRIHVSVDAVNRELYKTIRGVDAWEVVKENLKYVMSLRGEKIPIRFSSTIGVYNYNAASSIYLFAQGNNCLVNFYHLHTWGDLQMNEMMDAIFMKQLQSVVINENSCGKIISNARNLIIDKQYASKRKGCSKCYMPQVSATINCNGDIYPCCRLFGEIGEYGECVRFSYGNICGKTGEQLESEFKNRFNIEYPLKEKLCIECADRYSGMLEDLEYIIDGKQQPIFL